MCRLSKNRGSKPHRGPCRRSRRLQSVLHTSAQPCVFFLFFGDASKESKKTFLDARLEGFCHSSAPSSVCLHSKNVLFESVAGALCRVESVTSRTPSTTQQASCTTMRSRIRRSSARVASVARQLAAEVAAQLPAHCIRMPAQHNWLYGCLRWLASQLAEACVS